MSNILSIQSFGARLRVRSGLFVVFLPDLSGGGNDREEEFAVSTVESIHVHPKTSVSADVFLLAQRHQIPVLIHDEREMPTIFMAGLRPSTSIQTWHRQLMLHGTPEGLAFARNWLCIKVRRKIEWLSKLRSYRDGAALDQINLCLEALRTTLVKLSSQSLRPVADAAASLRGIEGHGQRVYLDTLSKLLPAQTRFDGRSRQPAVDLFNALLNYGYGILYNWVEQALWEAGLSPYIGFLHSDQRHHKSLLFDFIEPFRPWMDKVAFRLCVRKEINLQQHGRLLDNGGVWLNQEGRSLLAEAAYHRFEHKKVKMGDRIWRLRQAIKQEARQFSVLLRDSVAVWTPFTELRPTAALLMEI